jgi:hypothetical protein
MSDLDITDAEKVRRVTFDNQTTEMHDLDDQIKWDQYKASKKAATSKTCGMKFMKGLNPGTV